MFSVTFVTEIVSKVGYNDKKYDKKVGGNNMNVKIERLNSIFVKEISYILSTEVKDEDIKFVTITDCEITNDLSYAKVYFTVLDSLKKDETIKALDRAKSAWAGSLADRQRQQSRRRLQPHNG